MTDRGGREQEVFFRLALLVLERGSSFLACIFDPNQASFDYCFLQRICEPMNQSNAISETLSSSAQPLDEAVPQSGQSISSRAAVTAADFVDADYLHGLNKAQLEAVTSLEGPVMMLAGAGTGKTRALTTRLAHIVKLGLAQPWEILAVTFTNKAAKEMRERTASLVGGEAGEGLRWLGTFHAISAMMLRYHAEMAGLRPNFTILDADDQIRLCKQLIEAHGLDSKRWPARLFAGLLDNWKNKALTPDKVPQDDAFSFGDGKAIELYREYQQRLEILNAVDFGDLLLRVIQMFQANPDLLAGYQERLRYILVDEYQDTNVAQYLWLRLLSQKSKNICVVGDDDQSIYGWRGAQIDNILRFESDFPGAKIVRLEQNYRSTKPILAAAAHLINANQSRLGKTLWTEQEGGETVTVCGLWDGEAEARMVSDRLEHWKNQSGRRYDECAVLVRAAWQMRAFEDRFIMIGLPYKVTGGPRFFERAEIRDALAYLRLLQSENDDLAFERIINTPRRGIGAASVQKILVYARNQHISAMQAARKLVRLGEIKGKAKTGLVRFQKQFEIWHGRAADISHDELAEMILDESGYTSKLRADKALQNGTKLDNLKELVRSMQEFDSLPAYLEHIALVTDIEQQSSGDQIHLMTLHAAKGLEFPLVFLPGWEEEVFPSARSIEEKGETGLEEERRLAYVGLTRAREKAVISFAANRQIFGRWQSVLPSRFVDELPADQVEVVSETGYSRPISRRNVLSRWDETISQWSDEDIGIDIIHEAQGSNKILDGAARKVRQSKRSQEKTDFPPSKIKKNRRYPAEKRRSRRIDFL